MAATPPIVLTIAGFDPSSGAGVTADLKTIAAHQCYGVACITALTVQSTRGVRRTEPLRPGTVTETLQELLADVQIAAVHIGMLANAGIVAAVADVLEQNRLPHVVLDPILRSSSGAELLDASGTRLLVERLAPLAEVMTPNRGEAAVLTGMPVSDMEQMNAAAAALHSFGVANVVITGGDMEKATDLLSFRTASGTQEREVFKSERLKSASTHGTGCAFSSALACHLALNRGMPEAVLLSKAYVSAAIAHAYPVGHGAGPLHHLFRMNRQRRAVARVPEAEAAHSRS